LLVDDLALVRRTVPARLGALGCKVGAVASVPEALEWLEKYSADLILLDVMLPGKDGFTFCRELKADPKYREIPVIMFTDVGGNIFDRSMDAGADDYLPKPFDLKELITIVGRALAEPKERVASSADEGEFDSIPLVGRSPAMQEIYRVLARLMQTDLTVMISGESGTGKELVARALHDYGKRRNGPFVAVNMAAIPRDLIESELFGHEKGAFTGANSRSAGRFELAEGGTLFLDEIGDMPLAMQAKLLRAIQEREVIRVGGERRIPVQLRLVGATNSDLRTLVDAGRFREDLFYRVNVIHLRVPPLRARQDDILWLARVFLAEHARLRPGEAKKLSVAAEAALVSHVWPGNIRELQHCIARACIFARHTMLEPRDLFEDRLALRDSETICEVGTLIEFLQRCEREYLVRALNGHGWQINETATALGISRKNLWERMRRLHISESTGRND
jgi:two-component system nitrogen regulation response regulator GlnG